MGISDEHKSWWVGLTREEFTAAVAERLPIWREQRKPFRDHIGEKLACDLFPRRVLRRDAD